MTEEQAYDLLIKTAIKIAKRKKKEERENLLLKESEEDGRWKE